MRQILNISLPKEMADEIKRKAKYRRSTISEHIRAAIRVYHEYQLTRVIEKGRQEHREGKTVTLDSIRDLK